MEGAVQAGQRAAFEVLYDMRPACLDRADISHITYFKTHTKYSIIKFNMRFVYRAEPKQINRYKDTLKARMVDWRYILSVTVLAFLLYRNKKTRRLSVKLFALGKWVVVNIVYATKIVYQKYVKN